MTPERPSPEPDDDSLMAATARGDGPAFRLLVERWSPRVHAFLLRTLAHRADAEDLAQETFVRVYRAASRYAGEGRFAAWLFRIAGNLARGELRRRKVRGWFLGLPAVDEDEVLASLPAPARFAADGPALAAETRLALARALAQLPDRQRLAVVLHHFEGLGLRDVATALGTSEHAAESLLARGTAALRRRLRGLRA
jgi:RNA polymerase sigma-70 factor (ECF subfamily)